MRFRKHLSITLLTVFSLAPFRAVAQQDRFTSGIIKTEGGVLLVWNEPENYYTLEIKGEKVVSASTERLILIVDHKFLQILTVQTHSFMKDEHVRTQADQKFILTSHRDWEAQRIESTIKEKLNVESSWQKLSNGREALLWEYDMQ